MVGWTAVVPVEPWPLSSALPELPPERRTVLRRAFALDVLKAVRGCPDIGQVVLVTSRGQLTKEARKGGAVVLSDVALRHGRTAEGAVDLARHWALTWRPRSPVVVIAADLPCLTSVVLGEALRALAAHEQGFVTDRDGSGATVLSAVEPRRLGAVAFGAAAARQNRRAGAEAVPAVDPRVQHDVDGLAALWEARRLGLAPYSLAAVGELEATAPDPAWSRRRLVMQDGA